MGVELTHHLAHHTRALDVTAIRAQAHLVHHEQDATLHRLEPVTRVRQSA